MFLKDVIYDGEYQGKYAELVNKDDFEQMFKKHPEIGINPIETICISKLMQRKGANGGIVMHELLYLFEEIGIYEN